MGFLSGLARGIGPGIERAGETYAKVYAETSRRREDRANKLEDEDREEKRQLALQGAQLGLDVTGMDSPQMLAAIGERQSPRGAGGAALITRAAERGLSEEDYVANQERERSLKISGLQADTKEYKDFEAEMRRGEQEAKEERTLIAGALGDGYTIVNQDGSVNQPVYDKWQSTLRKMEVAKLKGENARAAYWARDTSGSKNLELKKARGDALLELIVPPTRLEIGHYPDSEEKRDLELWLDLMSVEPESKHLAKIQEKLELLRTIGENSAKFDEYQKTKLGAGESPPGEPLTPGDITPSITTGETPTVNLPGERYDREPGGGDRTAAALARSEALRGEIRGQYPDLGGTTVAPPNAVAPGGEQAPAPEVIPAPVPEVVPAPVPEIVPAPVPETVPTPAPETVPVPAQASLGEVDLGDLMPEHRVVFDKAEGVMAAWETKLAEEGSMGDLTEEQKVLYLNEVFETLYTTILSPLLREPDFDESSHPLLVALRRKYPQYAGTLTNE